MVKKTLIEPLHYHKESKKVFCITFHNNKAPLSEVRSDLDNAKLKAYHTLVSISFIIKYFLIRKQIRNKG